jgi:hypothetical protein
MIGKLDFFSGGLEASVGTWKFFTKVEKNIMYRLLHKKY